MILTILEFTIAALVAAFTAWEFLHIAEMKGYKQMKYFWWTLLFLPIGISMVIALPNKNASAKLENMSAEN